MRITKLLVRGVGDTAEVAIAGPLNLGGFSEPQPDVVLLRPRADYGLISPRSLPQLRLKVRDIFGSD